MKLLNHPSLIQDIIDLALMLPAGGFEQNEDDERNPVLDFLFHVREAAVKIDEYRDMKTWMHNGALIQRRMEQAKAASQSGDRQ